MDPLRRRRIEQALEGQPLRLASIKLEHPQRVFSANEFELTVHQAQLNTINPEDVFLDAWRVKYNNDPDIRVLEAANW